MPFRFQRRKKILPGVWINFSKKGISTTFGVRGAKINIGKRGTYLNTSIPGTGISERVRLDHAATSSPPPIASSEPAPYRPSIAPIVIGSVALCTSWMPTLTGASILFATLAIVFGAVSRSKSKKAQHSPGQSTAAIALGIVALITTVLSRVIYLAIQ